MLDRTALCMICSYVLNLLGFIVAVGREPNDLFWFTVAALSLGIGMLLSIIAVFLDYQEGLKDRQPDQEIVSQILDEYIDLLNTRGIDSEEIKTFRNRFQKNPKLLNLLDAVKMTKAVYSTPAQNS